MNLHVSLRETSDSAVMCQRSSENVFFGTFAGLNSCVVSFFPAKRCILRQM